MKVQFEYYHGWNDTEKEIIEYDDGTEDSEIQSDFEQWVWEKIGDNFGWKKFDETE